MRVLYLTNYHNPYRDEFFERLGRECDLTVLFEQRSDAARDESWFEGAAARSYEEVYLPEDERGPVSPTMLKVVGEGWSLVVVGCYNSPRQMAAISRMRRRRIPYVVNSDGPLFESRGIKGLVRRRVLRGADAYLVAGEKSVPSIRREVGRGALVAPYPFSSLTEARVAELASMQEEREEGRVLLVGQFLPYKGIDVALDALAGLSRDLRIRLVGTGKRSSEAEEYVASKGMHNVEVIPFLQPDGLVEEYLRADLFVLPSRQECWGLVVNEAAACGCPIVSTWGSGAAVEFLSRDYPQFLAEPNSAESLALSIKCALNAATVTREEYSLFLKQTAARYTVEIMVSSHTALFEARGASDES